MMSHVSTLIPEMVGAAFLFLYKIWWLMVAIIALIVINAIEKPNPDKKTKAKKVDYREQIRASIRKTRAKRDMAEFLRM